MRKIDLNRKTKETEIKLKLDIDGKGIANINTKCAFFNHMLEQTCMYSGFDLDLEAIGDIDIDYHHTIEDIGIVFGRAIDCCLGDKKGINRFAEAITPMDDALSMIAIDICGRSNLIYKCIFKNNTIGGMDIELIREFFKAFCDNSKITLHINLTYGDNLHHSCESIFKGFGRVLKNSTRLENNSIIMSTKGCI